MTREPFLRSLLNVTYKHKLSQLMKSRIEIPADKGRIMMGTVDEMNSLNSGEVYVQYSRNIDQPHADTEVVVGTVVIAKNPCLHPGDLRKFKAVDKPQLKHMVDCVVFPANGKRPHPNEMSGSDLDGDMYFVSWEESLVPRGENKTPMDYSPVQKMEKEGPITESDMIAAFAEYMKGDKLGAIANAHLVHADAQERGIFSEHCLRLAKKHSDAVDFPKTGQAVVIEQDLRPLCYPRYMEKQDKPEYISHHILAQLYNQCQAIQSAVSACSSRYSLEMITEDEFLIEGYDRHLENAKKLHHVYCETIENIMETYGVQTEAEVVTGQVLKFVQKRRGIVKRDYFEITRII